MWWRSLIAALATAGLGASGARAADGGRISLLAREAAEAVVPATGGSAVGSVAFVGAVVLGALLASLAGTWIGLRSQSVARIRERDGWRELTYRFRSPGPLRADRNLIGRMSGVLDEIEDLGRRLRSGAPVPEAALAAPAGVPATPSAGSPIRFRRGEDTAGVRAHWSPSRERDLAPATPGVAPSHPRAAAAEPPVARSGVPRAAVAGRDRAERYREARRLLQAGNDRETVRKRTGLKLAEVDLLRCAPGDAP